MKKPAKHYSVSPIRDKKDIAKMRAALARMGARDLILFDVGINTGLRISDILPLTVADVKRGYYQPTEQKTGKKAQKRKFKPGLQAELNEYIQGLQDDDYIFASRKGNSHIDRTQAYRILNAAAEKCGLEEIGTHTLRKTYGYHYYQETQDIATLQKIFNHSAPSVTLRYIGIESKQIEDSMDEFSAFDDLIGMEE